ncbi:class I SAM-dependent rRNA methyltransferase [Solitalea sp. MAHUQ-68]|uniref:Class I SAM-dependent rRNA methyltransferase n=1 Tax=Solitalea agri TaxID=2953739 RepID=A0A9X2JD99_9SPHI|nr:class I SAM-dependent rRNA methyltransferase [Solitalea agri]MCO4293394.1 class I SAM-dependent rRNA methyltransferase [Solitalea agri]
MKTLQLKAGKDKAVKQHHPWVFSGALETIKQTPDQGEIVRLINSKNEFLAYGYFNKLSKIAVRAIEWVEELEVDDQWWKGKIKASIDRRQNLLTSTDTNSFRLIYSEADGLPGLIVDKYADYLVMQVLTVGTEVRKQLIASYLFELLKPTGIYERSDATARSLEGLKASNGLLIGKEPQEFTEITENGLKFVVNIADGQKSGYFLDQRNTRKRVSDYANGLNVLDCFCYAGGFTLNARKAGAKSVTSVDSSALAIDMVRRNHQANGIDYSENELVKGDSNATLRRFQEENRNFDLIILDPPKLAPSRSAVDRALRAYKDLNLQALKILKSGGLLATFSCSGGVELNMLKQAVAWAALDAGKEVQFIEQFGHPEDHPILASFPESEYLKGVMCRIV